MKMQKLLKKPNRQQPAAPPSAVDEARQFCAEMGALRKAQAAADAMVRKREQALGDSRKALAAAQSAALVKNPDLDLDGTQSAESQAFVRATMELEQAKAALGGLKKRIAQHDVDILVVATKLTVEREAHNIEALRQFTDQTWEPARAAYAKVLRLAHALGAALGQPVPDVNSLPEAGAWEQDPAAVAIHAQNCELLTLAEDLKEFQLAAEGRVRASESEKRMLARSPFNADAGTRYKVRMPFTCYGRTFERGDEVTTAEIPVGMLSKLHSAGRLVVASVEEEF
jgi:hypothetical protein